jgi:hypothetical protein
MALRLSSPAFSNDLTIPRAQQPSPRLQARVHQSRYPGGPRRLGKRSDVLQAQRGQSELNLGDADEEAAYRAGDPHNPKRPKAGR